MNKINIREYLSSFIALVLLFIISRLNLPLFHVMVELFSIVITFAIFMFTWNTRKVINNNYLLFIGIAFIFIGFLDLMHTLTYERLNFLPVSEIQRFNYQTQLWMATRFLQNFIFLIAPFTIGRKLNIPNIVIILHLYVIITFLAIFYWQIFPDYYLNEIELTRFKMRSEMIITLILIAAIYNLVRIRHKFVPYIWKFILLAIIFSVMSELCFTFCHNINDLTDPIGYILRITSFFLIYRAIIIAGIRDPLESLFYDLNQSRIKLLEHKNKLELEVEKAVKEVEDRNKMLVLQSRHAQLGEMIAAITHQWKQPLNQISVISSAMVDAWEYDALDEELLHRSIGNITSVVNDMNNILEDFKNFYSPQTVDTDFDLTDIIDPIQALVGRRLKKYNIDLRIDMAPGITLKGKVNEIIQVMLILINNAVDTVYNREYCGCVIELCGRRSDGHIIISVKDSAGGIEDKIMDKIFEPYFTTKGKNGTGMGLFLARTIIEKHFQGNISAKNYPEGAVFTCLIPIQSTSSKLDG